MEHHSGSLVGEEWMIGPYIVLNLRRRPSERAVAEGWTRLVEYRAPIPTDSSTDGDSNVCLIVTTTPRALPCLLAPGGATIHAPTSHSR